MPAKTNKPETQTKLNVLIADETKFDTEEGMLSNALLEGNPEDVQSAIFHLMTGAGPLYLKQLREKNDQNVIKGIPFDNSYRIPMYGHHVGNTVVSGRKGLFA